jgi:hypothetical protein
VALIVADAQVALVTRWLTQKDLPQPAAIAPALVAMTRAQVSALLALKGDPSHG